MFEANDRPGRRRHELANLRNRLDQPHACSLVQLPLVPKPALELRNRHLLCRLSEEECADGDGFRWERRPVRLRVLLAAAAAAEHNKWCACAAAPARREENVSATREMALVSLRRSASVLGEKSAANSHAAIRVRGCDSSTSSTVISQMGKENVPAMASYRCLFPRVDSFCGGVVFVPHWISER